MDDYTSNPAGQPGYGQSDSGSSAGTAARMKATEVAADLQNKVTDFSRRAVDTIDNSRRTAADVLEQTASTLHSKGDQISGAAHSATDQFSGAAHAAADQFSGAAHAAADQFSGVAHSAADKVHLAADYVRSTDLKGMADDVKEIVKRYPGPSLAVAAALGFIFARSFRRGD